MIEVLSAKITGYVTKTSESYGSITIGKDMLEAVGMLENQMVWVHGNKFEKRIRTYVLEGEDGVIELNGNASYLFEINDKVHILATDFIQKFPFTKAKAKKIECQLQNNKNIWT